ncbi:F-box/kelch-repeat protein At3g23880-like [Silene latifolia]|uniref:F-box/kelch-repeat protein At3g23880-like n=1 Tax=Silene latifolia TaxID=37657 RepID=UPI003D7750CC
MSETNEFYLPEEILITYIFLRLPIKSLLRLKSVNKRFNSIISSPYFAKRHLKNSTSSNNNKNTHLLINHKTCFLSFDFESFKSGNYWDCSPFNEDGDIVDDKPGLARIIKGNFEALHSYIFAIGSCDGLVCLKTKFDFMHVWNPTTLACRKIPFIRRYNKKEDAVWGFGRVTNGRDYKIVQIHQNTKNNEKTIEIFSLLENSWTISQEKLEGIGEKPKLFGFGVSLNDVIYWLYSAAYYRYYDEFYDQRTEEYHRWWIIGLDLVKRTIKRVPLPEGEPEGIKIAPSMYVMEERLYACWEISGNHVVEVATLKEEGETSSWIKLYQLSHDIVPCYLYSEKSVANVTIKSRFAVEPYFDSDDGDRRHRDTLLFIDPARELKEDVLKLRIPSSRNVVSYTESLISPFCNS